MSGGYVLKKDLIIIQRDLTQLDLFVKKFIDVLEKHSDYLVVSGFVSISTGRIRGTEDIDILVQIMPEKKLESVRLSSKLTSSYIKHKSKFDLA